MKVGHLTLSNSTLKFWVESKPPEIVELYESVFLLRDKVSFLLYLSVTPEIQIVSLVVRLTFSDLCQTPNFATKKSMYSSLS